ncbi:hypothetical protein NPIL_182711 [Nephila pilipes]|uniref:Uncharacterized protein n=1 Tax=Nephila pilipes TaxID=299642 RepID=A0A8X6NCL4_NEPPI|nr:hypothetical protein NPIL_182711 [Nephila pilipes]
MNARSFKHKELATFQRRERSEKELSRVRPLSTSISFKPTKVANRATPFRRPPANDKTAYQHQLLSSTLPYGLSSPGTSQQPIRTIALTTLTESMNFHHS